MDNECFNAWAINTCSDEGHGLIGRYWWFEGNSPVIPTHLEGCKVALFKTRKIARINLTQVKRAFPEAKVIKVEVAIQPIENKKEEK